MEFTLHYSIGLARTMVMHMHSFESQQTSLLPKKGRGVGGGGGGGGGECEHLIYWVEFCIVIVKALNLCYYCISL